MSCTTKVHFRPNREGIPSRLGNSYFSNNSFNEGPFGLGFFSKNRPECQLSESTFPGLIGPLPRELLRFQYFGYHFV